MRHAVRSIVNLPLRVGVLLFGIAGAPAAPAATPGDEPWQLAAAASAPGTSVPAGLGEESLLFWSRLEGLRVPAESAHLLVQAPYATVKAAVSASLRGQGPWQEREAREPLSELPEDWAPVLLSRRADLRAALAAHAPELEAAVAAGALTAEEARQRQQQARGRVDASPAQWRALAVFGTTGYDSYFAGREARAGRAVTQLRVFVFDVSAAFGRPATALRVERTDTFPNPDARWIRPLRDFSVMGGGSTPRQLTRQVVPGSVFAAVRDAALAVAPGAVQVAASPQRWALPAPPRPAVPSITFKAVAPGWPRHPCPGTRSAAGWPSCRPACATRRTCCRCPTATCC